MLMSFKGFAVSFIAGGIVLGSSLVFAGAADVVSSDGNIMKFEYQGDKLRINPGNDQNSYMVLRDGHIYIVSNSNGQLMVIDANKAMGMFGGMAGAATPSSVAGEVVSLEATGRLEKHAGITGEVYDLEYIDADGKTERGELVLSEDERAREFSTAMSDMARSMAKTTGHNFDAAAKGMQQRLDSLDMGVLRYGEDMRISAISDRSVDAARFELPAEPTDLTDIGALMRQSRQSAPSEQSTASDSGNSSSGGLGGFLEALGGGKSSQQDSAEPDEKSDDAEDQQDSGNALEKALGKLFGN